MVSALRIRIPRDFVWRGQDRCSRRLPGQLRYLLQQSAVEYCCRQSEHNKHHHRRHLKRNRNDESWHRQLVPERDPEYRPSSNPPGQSNLALQPKHSQPVHSAILAGSSATNGMEDSHGPVLCRFAWQKVVCDGGRESTDRFSATLSNAGYQAYENKRRQLEL